MTFDMWCAKRGIDGKLESALFHLIMAKGQMDNPLDWEASWNEVLTSALRKMESK